MLWEVEIRPLGRDAERDRVAALFGRLTGTDRGADVLLGSSRGFLLEADLPTPEAQAALLAFLADPLAEQGELSPVPRPDFPTDRLTVLLKPGVMDPVSQSVLAAAADLQLAVRQVRSFRRYALAPGLSPADADLLSRKVLANPAIEDAHAGPPTPADVRPLGRRYEFRKVTVPLRDLDDAGLERVSREGQLALNRDEMRAVRDHFRDLGRDPTDVELETIAQTWSEHCSHKTLKGPIDYTAFGQTRRIPSLLKETVFGATQTIRERLGADDWCVSVFEDNAGVVKFSDRHHLCFKVETHNHPSAIEPYGGANTGLGGVIRDILGTGLGAKPIANTDVFCFAPPSAEGALPPGVLHPRQVMAGVVSGVRDYGNRMGIPTVNGAVVFDERYLANPLVYCGTVGLLPVDCVRKEAQPGDLIVTLGGRTGRDGIHGATFSSLELTAESESVSGGAVQIGNAITQKKLADVLLAARDRGLYSAVTDCGAGGFSSAVGEMGADLGAVVHLEQAPLKYEGLSYTEVWISEAQERMVLAVPPALWPELEALCKAEDVEAAVLGTFEDTGRLRLLYQDQPVADLDMHFLHKGRPSVVRKAEWHPPATPAATPAPVAAVDLNADLLRILSAWNVCSKEWVVRQYDHEVQGATVIKPLVGVAEDGPGDAAVITPELGSFRGAAIGCGLNPHYADLDPYWMAACAIDEAVRNVVAVGADPTRVAVLDNFCWGNVNDPAVLGSLVRAAEACRDVAVAYGTPFISGKDSLNNEYRSGDTRIVIPGTLLVSALGLVPDVRRCVTMDLKEPGNELYLVGATRDELGGSHLHLARGLTGGAVPRPDLEAAPAVFRGLHAAITRGLVRACHDLSEGGLAVAAAEMAFAGGVGADLTEIGNAAGGLPDEVFLFSESPTRFLVEVRPGESAAFRECLAGVPVALLGRTTAEPRLRAAGSAGEWVLWASLADLKAAWQRPLRDGAA